MSGDGREPKDTGRLVLGAYFALGISSLLLWNAFITAFDYYKTFYANFDGLVAVVYNPASLTSILVILAVRHNISNTSQIRIGLAGYLAVLVLLCSMNRLAGRISRETYLAVTLCAAGVCGLLTGCIQGPLLGEASSLPIIYPQAVIAGNAASGFLVALLRVATKVALPHTNGGLALSAFVYFAAALAFTAACLILHTLVLPRSPFVQFHKRRRALAEAPLEGACGAEDNDGAPLLSHDHAPSAAVAKGARGVQTVALPPGGSEGRTGLSGESSGEASKRTAANTARDATRDRPPSGADPHSVDRALLADCANTSGGGAIDNGCSPPGAAVRADCAVQHSTASGAAGALRHEAQWLPQNGHGDLLPRALNPARNRALTRVELLTALRPAAFACFVIYTGTMIIFPGFLLAEAAANSAYGDWAAVAAITLFTFCDMASRFVPVPRVCFQPSFLALSSLLRMAVVIFVACFKTLVLRGDASRVLFMIAFGASNGFLSSCAMLSGSRYLDGSVHAGAGGNFLVLSLVAGLVAGSFLGWLAL